MFKQLILAGLLAGTVIIPSTQPGDVLTMPNGDVIVDTGGSIVTKDGSIARTPNPIDQQNQQDLEQLIQKLKDKNDQ
ncbi:hypothetical protein [Desulfoferula mesophila]|uniref:Uncharacterized protein n=1 Tax=Desulfoferula mesophila TaxID=3058419 RepID=A0AAU9ES96_9BACT|nr:hypothetical protein FAK_30950 [Desulfoferula mesophilus]